MTTGKGVRALFDLTSRQQEQDAALWAAFFVQTSSHDNKSGTACALFTPTMVKMTGGHQGRYQPLGNPGTGALHLFANRE
jgi:hypothetical protein